MTQIAQAIVVKIGSQDAIVVKRGGGRISGRWRFVEELLKAEPDEKYSFFLRFRDTVHLPFGVIKSGKTRARTDDSCSL